VSGQDAPSPKSPATELLSILAANVRSLRAESGWSTRAFADHVGLSLSTLYGIEHGTQKTVRLSTVARLGKGFGVHVSVLLTRGAQPRRPWSGEEPLSLAAENLFKLRKAKSWSQEELASRASVSRDIVTKVERETCNLTLEILDRLARALATPAAELFRTGTRAKNRPGNGSQ
jgi:transcriptional regulator with XRE-family HTH domain